MILFCVCLGTDKQNERCQESITPTFNSVLHFSVKSVLRFLVQVGVTILIVPTLIAIY